MGALARGLETLHPGFDDDESCLLRANLVASSAQGDLIAIAGAGMYYGFARRDALLAVLSCPFFSLRKAGFNAAGDAVFVAGRSCVGVGIMPPRATDGGAPLDSRGLKPWAWTSVCDKNSRVVEVKWHAYADDHLGCLDASGRLRLWDCVSRRFCAEAAPVGAIRATDLSWGASGGWARLSALVLADTLVYAACPLAPRRAAIPQAAARAMRRAAWPLASAWLDASLGGGGARPEPAEFIVLAPPQPAAPVDLVPVARLESAAAMLYACDIDAILAIAFECGRLDFGIARGASVPHLDDDDDDDDEDVVPFAALDSVIIAPPDAKPVALMEAPTATLCYATSSGVALVDAPWLDDDLSAALDAGEIPETDRAVCRHLVAEAEVVAVAFVVNDPGIDACVWFSDGSAAAVNATAARVYSRLVDPRPRAPPPDDTLLPRLADELVAKARDIRAALDAFRAPRGALEALVDARHALERDVVAPLHDATGQAQALARLLAMARAAQATDLARAVERATAAAARLETLDALARACSDRADSLANRAGAVSAAATQLQPKLSKADRAYRADVRALADAAGRAERSVAATRARVRALDDAPLQHPPLTLADDNLRLCHSLLDGQHAMLQAADADLSTLQATVDLHS